MKRILITLGIVTVLTTPATACAQPFGINSNIDNPLTFKATSTEKPKLPEKPVEPPPAIVYVVVEGDSLTKIGAANNVEWQRLWAKNTQLTQPDRINVGDHITIPLPTEQLSREIPAAIILPPATPARPTTVAAKTPSRTSANYGGGNTYDYGYCTWYVKNRRGASLPNNLGNANTWYARAHAQGMATGSAPRTGAVGTTTRGALGHVIYVESVNGNGSINISEMNAPVFGGITYRTASASEFSYIY